MLTQVDLYDGCKTVVVVAVVSCLQVASLTDCRLFAYGPADATISQSHLLAYKWHITGCNIATSLSLTGPRQEVYTQVQPNSVNWYQPRAVAL